MSWLDTLEEIRKTDWSKVAAEDREAKAREVVNICAYAAAATSVVPIPLADLVLLLPVHTVMVMTVGHVHGRKLSGAEAKRVVVELGAIAGVTVAGGAAVNALRKLLLPAIGGIVAVPMTFALTWALGRVSIEYFANPALTREDLKKKFNDAVQEGKSAFSKEAFDRFRQKNKDAKVPEVDEKEVPAAQPPPPKKDSKSSTPEPEPPKRKKRTL